MDKLFQLLEVKDKEFIEKVNYVAGYFIFEKFNEIDFRFDKINEFKQFTSEKYFTYFSPFVQKLCCDNYSKLFILILFAYFVEV